MGNIKTAPTNNKQEHARIFILNETIIRTSPTLACEIGLNESMILLQLDFWINITDNYYDGRYWTYQSVRDMQKKAFPFWSIATINRAINKLLSKHYIIEANFNTAKFDKTRWFSLDYDKLSTLTSIAIRGAPAKNMISPEANLFEKVAQLGTQWPRIAAQNDTRANQNDTRVAQNETTIPENTTENTTENIKAASINNPGGPVDEQGKNAAAFKITKKSNQPNPDSSSSFLPGLKTNNGSVTPPHSRPKDNHDREPATTVVNSPPPSTPPAEMVGSEYMLAVDEKMSKLKICAALSAADSPLVSQMEKEGIPLPLVLGIMDEVFQRNAKSQKGKKIRSFSYFVPAIQEAFKAMAQPQDREREYAATRRLIERLA